MFKKAIFVVLGMILLIAANQDLTGQPRSGRGGFGGRGGRGRGGFAYERYSPVPINEQEKHILSVLEDMNRNQSGGMMNVPTVDGRILRLLTETTNAKHVVEIGTSNGYSGIWFCLALRATGGKLTTHEIDQGRASLARENFKIAGVEKLVTLVMGDAHQTVTRIKEPIDILFIDADKEGYIDYLNKLLPLVRPGGLILSHNIDSTTQDYINAITTNPVLETIQTEGVTITLKKRRSNAPEAAGDAAKDTLNDG
ncbi:MAG: class I SAM-dependent methyltransferase [Sedimentisphaerales bacterium]|nr:class I SAM-dependent methyltransferase [Sedimentisphaerales bacterium]